MNDTCYIRILKSLSFSLHDAILKLREPSRTSHKIVAQSAYDFNMMKYLVSIPVIINYTVRMFRTSMSCPTLCQNAFQKY